MLCTLEYDSTVSINRPFHVCVHFDTIPGVTYAHTPRELMSEQSEYFMEKWVLELMCALTQLLDKAARFYFCCLND